MQLLQVKAGQLIISLFTIVSQVSAHGYYNSQYFTTLDAYLVYWTPKLCTKLLGGWSQCTIVIVMATRTRLQLASTPVLRFSSSFVKHKSFLH